MQLAYCQFLNDSVTSIASSQAHYSLIHNGMEEISDASVEITLGYISNGVVNIVQQFGLAFTEVRYWLRNLNQYHLHTLEVD